jgi:hypothetical protein
MNINIKLNFLILLLGGLMFTSCNDDESKVKSIDEKLTGLFSYKDFIEDDSLNFITEFEKSLRDPLTYNYNLDSLLRYIDIVTYDDVKLYNFQRDEFEKQSENFWTGHLETYSYLQYQLNDRTDFIRFENKGKITGIYKFNYNRENFYLIVSFYYNEDTGEDEGGVLRVLKEHNNRYVLTDDLFPHKDMFNNVISLHMDNFSFDPKTREFSYDDFGVDDDGSLKVIGRLSWVLQPK